MEHRQRIEADVGKPEIEARSDLSNVGEKIGVRQRHALGRAFRAGGEQHDRRIVRLALGERRTRLKRGAQLVHRRCAGAHFLKPDDARTRFDRLDLRLQFALLDERARGQHQTDASLLARRDQIVCAGGEVEHRRHAPCGLQRHEGHRGAVGVGQHHADRLARLVTAPRSCAPTRRRRCGTCASSSRRSADPRPRRARGRAPWPAPRTPRATCVECRTSGTGAQPSGRRARVLARAALSGRAGPSASPAGAAAGW